MIDQSRVNRALGDWIDGQPPGIRVSIAARLKKFFDDDADNEFMFNRDYYRRALFVQWLRDNQGWNG